MARRSWSLISVAGVLSQDLLRTRHREQVFLHACLSTQLRFVVDRTNATVEEGRRYLQPALEAGFHVTCCSS